MVGNFEQQLSFGKIGEGRIASWLREKKAYNALPVYEKEIKEGKGPALFSTIGQLIAPDLLCFKSNDLGSVLWVEAKTKTAFTWHRLTRRWVTGIDLRHYEDYQKVASLSPFPVWVLFLHLCGTAKDTPQGMVSPSGLFGRELAYLTKHENHRHGNWGKGGMVYWAIEDLKKLAAIEDVLTESEAAFTKLEAARAEQLAF